MDGNIAKYLAPLNELPVDENFDPTKSIPWTSRTGIYYALPYVGVVQGIYYNQGLFRRYGIVEPPLTWEDFLADLQTIYEQDPEVTAIANALNASEDSEMFMSIAANFLGGPAGRERFMKTDGSALCFNDLRIVDTFKTMDQLKPYLPRDAATINSQNSKELFFNQKAVMLFGGSWDLLDVIGKARFDWDVFAAPAPRLGQTYVIFQPDVGIGINKDSVYGSEARIFLEWLMTKQAIDLTAEKLVGFYPLNKLEATNASESNDAKFLRLVNDYPSDIRWMYTEISNKSPSALEIVRQDLYEMAAFDLTPEEAAQHLQAGLGEWYAPAQSCQ